MASEPVLAPESQIREAEPTLLTPISSQERIASIDVLRGFALLGILTINIWGFALPSLVYNDPSAAGGWPGLNKGVWIFSHLLFEQKMMSLFSMLFGAGLIVMVSRADARSVALTAIYYRRIVWLLVFGLLHAYLLWYGDILVPYGLCGLVLYPFRRLRPRTQIVLGMIVFLSLVPLDASIGLLDRHLQKVTGPQNDQGPVELRELRSSLEEGMLFSREIDEEEINDHRGSFEQSFRRRAATSWEGETFGFFFWAGPRAGGLMLMGMGLMQLGVFAATRSYCFYTALTFAGYALGLPIVGYGIYAQIRHDFDPLSQILVDGHYNYLGSLFVALGHAGLVLLICKAGLLRWLTVRLTAVGRMALSNYLMQSLFCAALFEGWGFGLFGKLDRFQLLGVVASIWIVQLLLSPLWLHYFRFGPMEWLWRSLTYWKWYPFRAVLDANGSARLG